MLEVPEELVQENNLQDKILRKREVTPQAKRAHLTTT